MQAIPFSSLGREGMARPGRRHVRCTGVDRGVLACCTSGSACHACVGAAGLHGLGACFGSVGDAGVVGLGREGKGGRGIFLGLAGVR